MRKALLSLKVLLYHCIAASPLGSAERVDFSANRETPLGLQHAKGSKILLVAATELEVKGLPGASAPMGTPCRLSAATENRVDVLVTGVGAVPTAFYLARFAEHYDLVLNIGIAGTYSPAIGLGQVVVVVQDCLGDYGIDDRGLFVPLGTTGLASAFPDVSGLSNPWLGRLSIPERLVRVRGVTLGTASGSEVGIGEIRARWNPHIETMECAAVFYSCLLLGKPFVCLRGISNLVEPRDKGGWRVKEALDNLHAEVCKLLKYRILSNLDFE